MTIKIPPPPRFADDPAFNRWLLELTSILSNQGGIDPDQLNGLQQDFAEVENQIVSLQNTVRILQLGIATVSNRLQNGVVKPPDSSGLDGDWFGVTGGPQKGVYIRVAGAWVQVAT